MFFSVYVFGHMNVPKLCFTAKTTKFQSIQISYHFSKSDKKSLLSLNALISLASEKDTSYIRYQCIFFHSSHSDIKFAWSKSTQIVCKQSLLLVNCIEMNHWKVNLTLWFMSNQNNKTEHLTIWLCLHFHSHNTVTLLQNRIEIVMLSRSRIQIYRCDVLWNEPPFQNHTHNAKRRERLYWKSKATNRFPMTRIERGRKRKKVASKHTIKQASKHTQQKHIHTVHSWIERVLAQPDSIA